jgi:radical SAM protein with 4Fe4S-binding SPASM domain
LKFNKIYIELTNICGLSCSFCPSDKPTPKTLSLNQFSEILDKIKPHTNIITYHMFGDPLTLTNLKEYLDITHQKGIKVEIVTTGYYLNRFDLNLFLHPAIRQVNFSLNSFDKNEMNLSLDEYLEPMFKLCKLKLQNKIHNFINFRLWNIDTTHTNNDFNKSVFEKLEQQFNVNVDRNSFESQRLENQILLDFDTYFQWPSLDSNHKSEGTCFGLKSHLGILANGTVVPCCLDTTGIIDLGNIFDSNLEDILKTKKAQNIINGFNENRCSEELCQKCSFKDRFNKPLSKS